jgi:hypothetical protein
MGKGVKLIRVSGILAMIAAGAVSADDRQDLVANLDLVRGVAKQAVEKLVVGLEPSAGRRVRILVDPFHETAWLVQDLTAEALRARGFEVMKAPMTGASTGGAPHAPAGSDSARAPANAGADTARAPANAGADSARAPADSAQAVHDTTLAGTELAGNGNQGTGNPDPGHASTGNSSAGTGRPGNPAHGSSAQDEGNSAASASVDAELSLRVVELGLRYTGSNSGFLFFGGRDIERYAAARFHGELRRPGDPVIRWSGDGDASVIDEVPESALPILEGQHYPFTAPSLPAGRSGRWLEPLIVSVIVVGLVVLFVSNRS